MKITVTPDAGDGPVENLAALGRLIERANTTVRAAGGDPAATKVRVRLTLGQSVKQVELSW